MKKIFSLSLVIAASLSCFAQVKPGVEVLRERNFEVLEGKRVGLLTNPTGVDNDLKSTVDILSEAPNVNLTALFAPEHGVRGDMYAGDKVNDTIDAKTGVKVHSIFGKTRKPTDEMLEDIDVMVYDIQDNGCRSFTFISSMANAMDACAKLGKEFVVLDRPNPLGGEKVEGNLTEEDCISFVSQLPIPYLYGLTPGELANYINEAGLLESGKKVNLTVVPMEGWTRDMKFEDTGMPWVLPSPHIPSAEIAVYYPASGILGELYYINIGIGYTLPFKTFAAPWIDRPEEFAQRMNALNIPGVKFRPIHYKPFYSTSKDENIAGVEFYITDFEQAPLSMVQFYAMQELADMYPDHLAMNLEGEKAKRYDMFNKVVGSKKIKELFAQRNRVEDIEEYWNKDAEKFKEDTRPYRMY